jgi:glycosyltransferase involved in cell wall biosynthesis
VLNVVGLELGGAETTVVNYYRYINRSKVQFDFLIPDKPDNQYYEDEVISLGARVFRMPADTKFRNIGLKTIEGIKSLIRILKRSPKIDIIHFHADKSMIPAFCLLVAMFMGVKVRVVYSRLTLTGKQILHRLFRPLLNMVTTHKTACSVKAGVSMFGKNVCKDLVLIPRARDLSVFRYDKERRQIKRDELQITDKFVIVQVGRLAEQKNHKFTLRAFENVLKTEQNMILLFVGDGELRDELVKMADELILGEKVMFLGNRRDVQDILQAADLFVFPSLYEGLGAVAIEAQAAGLPCLISDTVPKEAKITGLAEFLPIDKGPEIWAERLLGLKSYKREDMVDIIKKAGYDIHDAAKWLEDYYSEAVSGRKKQ